MAKTSTASTDEQPSPLLSEHDRVVAWREQRLLDAGFPDLDAFDLAHTPAVDVHVALKLLRDGCAVETAVDILR